MRTRAVPYRAGRRAPDPRGEDAPAPPVRGAVLKVFAVVLMALATLNAMLAWRGGFSLSGMPTALFLAGLALYAFGAARGRAGRASAGSRPEHAP